MPKSDFVELAVLRDPDGLGVVAPITVRKRPNGFVQISFAVFKEFERGGETQRTSFLNRRHIGALRKLLDEIESFFEKERDRIFEGERAGRGAV